MHATDHGPRSYATPEGNPRDVFNEAPRKEDRLVEAEASKQAVLGKEAVVHTTYGDIRIKLFPEECPRTIENFSCVTTCRVPLRACSCRSASATTKTVWPPTTLAIRVPDTDDWTACSTISASNPPAA